MTSCWVLGQLWRKGNEKSVVRIPETLVIEENGSASWYFTSKNGALKRKSGKTMGENPVETAVQQFLYRAIHRSERVDPDTFVAALVTDNSGTVQKLTISDLENGKWQESIDGIAMIQENINSNHPGLICRCKLNENNITYTTKVVTEEDKLPLTDQELCKEIDRIANKIIAQIYTNSSCKIRLMKIHFRRPSEKSLMATHFTSVQLVGDSANQETDETSQSSSKRKCAGDFCGFPNSIDSNIMIASDKLVKIPYRSILLAPEFYRADPNIEAYMKRKEACKIPTKSISVISPSMKSLRFVNDIPIVEMKSELEVVWNWTGDIADVQVTLQQIACEVWTDLCLKDPNSGRMIFEIPVFEEEPAFWRIRVQDSNDIMVFGLSDAFMLVRDEDSTPSDMNIEIPIPMVSEEEQKAATPRMPTLGNYNRQVRVCPTCAEVYRQIDSLRLAGSNISIAQAKPSFTESKLKLVTAMEEKMEKLSKAKSRKQEYVENKQWGPGFDLRKEKIGAKPEVTEKPETLLLDGRDSPLPPVQTTPRSLHTLENGVRSTSHHTPRASRVKGEAYAASPRSSRGAAAIARHESLNDTDVSTPLDISEIASDSALFQVINALALGKLQDCKRFMEFASRKGVAALAFCRISNGVIVEEQVHGNSFDELLQKTIRGRQTLLLLNNYLKICSSFAYVVETPMHESQNIEYPESVIEDCQVAISTLEELVASNRIAQSRLHVLKGAMQSFLTGSPIDEWKLGFALSVRYEGMWSYNVGISHFLIGKYSGDPDLRERHLSTAHAIFSRLSDKLEVTLVKESQMRSHQTSVVDPGPNDDKKLVNNSENDNRKLDLQEYRSAVDKWQQKLVRAKLMPRYLISEFGNTRFLQCSKETQDVIASITSSIDEMSISSQYDATFESKKSQIESSLHLLQLKVNQLFALAKQCDYKVEIDLNESSNRHIAEEEEPVTMQQLFDVCANHDLGMLTRLLPRWVDSYGTIENIRDDDGNTLLHLCAYDNWIKGIHTCLSFGIDVNTENNYGDTAINLALEQHNDTAVALLTALGGY